MSAVDFLKKRYRGLSLGRAKAFREESPKSLTPAISFMTPAPSVSGRSTNETVVEDRHLSMIPGNKAIANAPDVVQYSDPHMQANYNNWKRDRDHIILDKQTERALIHQKYQANMVNLCAEYSQEISDIEDRTSDKLAALTFQHARDVARAQQPLKRKTALLDPKYSYLPPPKKRTTTDHERPRTPLSASAGQNPPTFQHDHYAQSYQRYQHQSQSYPESARTYSDATRQSQIVEVTEEEYEASIKSRAQPATASSSNTTLKPINPRQIKQTLGSPPPRPPATLSSSSRNLSTKASNISSWSYQASPQQLDHAYQHYPRSIIPIQRPHTSNGYNAYSAYPQSVYAPTEHTGTTQQTASRAPRASRNIRANEFGQRI